MKKLCALLVGGFMLAGCTTTGGLDKERLAQIIAQVRDGAAKVCQFLPDAANLATLVGNFYDPAKPAAMVVSAAVDAICAAPTTAGSVRRGVTRYTRIVDTPKGAVPITGRRY